MPRGPYQGTYQPNLRPTVVHGPDALVYINGETDLIGCGSCRRKVDFNSYITSVQVDLSVESVPGSASVSLSIPRHAVDDFFFEGEPIITPMMEIEIFAKGYYLIEGVPQYYPIFWGLVTEVGEAFSGGEHTLSIQCSDILKWWELCKMNINPALTAASGQAGRSIFGNVFFGMNPYDVIWTCAQQAFGDVVIGSGSLVSLVKENGSQAKVFQESLHDIMAYWEQRFARARSNLLLYGTNGVAIRGDSLYEAWTQKNKGQNMKPFASQAVRNANGGTQGGQMVFDPTDPDVVAFRTQFSQAGQVNFFSSEYQTKLELANAAKEAIGFEFYMDVTGDIVFKPPFFNLDILSNKPVSWIQDIDVIDWDFSESESEVITQLTMQGSFGGNTDYGFSEEVTPYSSVTDYHLLRKYGWRSHSYNSEFMGDTQLMFYHGMDILDRINSKRHRGSISIPLRPELRLGFPIYVASKDKIWYVQGISHNIQFGGRAATTLTLTAKRGKFFAPRGIGNIDMTSYTGPTAAASKSAKPDPKAKNAQSGAQKGAPAVQPNLPFKYSTRQLAKNGKFTVNIGRAATIPPTIDDLDSLGKDNPYAPLILRHPKTGRAIGYPNVIMVYTRPFAPPNESLAKNLGQKTKRNPQVDKKAGEKAAKKSFDQLTSEFQKQNTANAIDDARDTLLNNRYQYGLNSAGVFVYAHDKKQLFGEVTFVTAQNITTQYNGGAAPTAAKIAKGGKSAMIRPISDERGFEVIGHFRYGRGMKLRDGQLVHNPGQKNQAAAVNLQVALAGDLFASLTAQAQGITTLTTAYANPVDAITRLLPEDLQTAGQQNEYSAGKTAQAFLPTGKNFVDTAPLGSAEQKGMFASVEAGQLSRAVTIAELNIMKDGGGVDAQCGCIAGRADLAFMSVGYQLKPLFVNTMGGVAPALSGTNAGGPVDPVLAQALKDGTPVTDEQYRSVLGGQNVMDRVDQFLFSLYSALDGPHQQYEAALRGESLELEFPTAEEVRFGQPGAADSELSPPFNPANRLAVGDPEAFAAQGSSAKADLKRTWTEFGSKLQKNSKEALIQGELKLVQKELNETNSELEDLLAQREREAAGGSIVLMEPPINTQIDALVLAKAKLEKQVGDKTLELQQL